MERKITYSILIFSIITVLFLTVTNFPNYMHIAEPKLVMRDRFLWDKGAMDMMKKVNTLVPPGATIAVSDYKPDFEYATKLRAVQPYDLSSTEKVHSYVSNYTSYLVVVEHDWDPNIIWGTKHLHNLSKYYNELGTFTSDYFKIHVLKDKFKTGDNT